MMLLETYTTLSPDELKLRLPDFLKLGPEVTGEPAFSMYNLTLKGGWIDNANFCHKLSDDKEEQERQVGTIYIFDIISFFFYFVRSYSKDIYDFSFFSFFSNTVGEKAI